MASVYEYDVFISFDRKAAHVAEWVTRHFAPMLKRYLQDNIGDVAVFTPAGTRSGDRWPRLLERALLGARLLIPVCTPNYFRDEWCMAEWKSMEERERVLGMASRKIPNGLIHPVIFGDSETYPSYAHERTPQDCREYAYGGAFFESSADYLGFERLLREFAVELTAVLAGVPSWRADFPVRTPAPEDPLVPALPRL
ncbi:toll/interleukin-1 receptor domain-containing protein [Actinokineospora pegani]|uniref:toll/interleukin-1 receptor domain-containing protein n=1 Tax=Actinokineospora pegani TaxID=2654637 RepID=UPI0018D3FED0|nr:toll/interleukin-1 receptor domain-containing protein [Actinokineospora pegani]